MKIDSNIRLGIGLPATQSHLPAEFVDSFFVMNKPAGFGYIRPMGGGTIDLIRNQLVDIAITNRLTHLLMMDTDQTYPVDTVTRLLKHAENGVKFVAGKVHRRALPYDPIMVRGKIGDFLPVPDEEWLAGGLVEVDSTGFGCVLMDIEEVQKLPRPYFKFDTKNKPPVGEDFYFWAQVKAAGHKIYVDCDLKIGHIASLVIMEESYKAYKQYGDLTK